MNKHAEKTRQKIIKQLNECEDEYQLFSYLLGLSEEIKKTWEETKPQGKKKNERN